MLLVNDTPQSHVDLDDPDAPGVRVRPPDGPRPRPGRGAGRAARRRPPRRRRPHPPPLRRGDPARLPAARRRDRPAAHRPRPRAPARCPAAPASGSAPTTPASAWPRCTPTSADVVVCDVFAGARTPAHLTSAEFAAEVHRVLRPGGVYAANVADGPPLRFARAQVATLRSVFRHVCLLAEPGTLRGRRFGNLVAVASDAELPIDDYVRRCARDPMPARVVHGARPRPVRRHRPAGPRRRRRRLARAARRRLQPLSAASNAASAVVGEQHEPHLAARARPTADRTPGHRLPRRVVQRPAVDAGRDRRERDAARARARRRPAGSRVAGAQDGGVVLRRRPDRPGRVHHPARGQPAGRRRDRLAPRQPPVGQPRDDRPALGEDRRARRPRWIAPSTPPPPSSPGIGRVHDHVDVRLGDVAAHGPQIHGRDRRVSGMTVPAPPAPPGHPRTR